MIVIFHGFHVHQDVQCPAVEGHFNPDVSDKHALKKSKSHELLKNIFYDPRNLHMVMSVVTKATPVI